MTRREFNLCAGGTAVAVPLYAQGFEDMPWKGPATVKRVYLAVQRPTWPRPDLDVNREKASLESNLAELERRHAADIRFSGGELVRTAEDAEAWVKGLGDADAVLIVDLTSGTGGMLRPFREVDIPILLYSRPYSGWSYVDVTAWVQAGKKADLIVTSEVRDLDPYMRVFHTIRHLRRSKVLAITPSSGARQVADGFTRQFGTAITFLGYQDLKAAFDGAEVEKAEKAAAEFTRAARRVLEPSRDEIRDALRFYLGVLDLLRREKANAMTIDCLGGFRRGELPAYPCVAWSKLNDQGLYGVCEGDLHSTMTQMLVTSFSGKPGFVSDPVFDTGRGEIIHAHCVAATALQGVGGPGSPYIIRSHMEDNKCVSMQVLAPAKGVVTVAKFTDPRKLVISTGEVTGNVDSGQGCRTQIRTRVAGARKMLAGFSGGLHRVVFYGDYVGALERMSRLMGFQMVREM